MFVKGTVCSRWGSCRTDKPPCPSMAQGLQRHDSEEFNLQVHCIEELLQELRKMVILSDPPSERSNGLPYTRFWEMDEAGGRHLISCCLSEIKRMTREKDLQSRGKRKATVKGSLHNLMTDWAEGCETGIIHCISIREALIG